MAFLSDRGTPRDSGAAHLWVWDRGSARLRLATDLPVLDPWGRLGRLEWLADSRTVLVKTYPDELSPSAYARFLTSKSDERLGGPDSGVTAQVFKSDTGDGDATPRAGPNNLNYLLGDLALVDVETGAVRRLVRDLRLCTYALSPDRRMLAYAVATGFERPGSYQILVDLFVYDLQKNDVRRLVAGARLVYGYPNFPVFAWSPNSDAIAYRTDGPPGTKDEVYVVALSGGAPRRVADGPVLECPLYAGRPLWDGEGRGVFFVRTGALWHAALDDTGATRLAALSGRDLRMVEQGSGRLWSPDGGRNAVVITGNPTTKRMGLARVDLRTGRITQMLEEDRWYDTTRADPMVVTPDGKSLVHVAEDSRHPPDLWITRGHEPTQPRQISHVTPGLPRLTATAKLIGWQDLDGGTLHGALILPAGPPPSPGFPLIVKVYGGEDVSADLNRFGFAPDPVENLHVLTTRGYAVLLADSKVRVGTPMLDLLKTVMPGVDRAISLGLADPDRLGIMGHSYGGYSALALVVQSGRFKAAVVRAGFGDLIGAYGQLGPDGTNYMLPWAEQGQGRMGATLWEARARYVENSPIFYLDRVTAPLLIIHGGTDRNVPPFLADEVFSGLRRLGKAVEYVRYAGEGHWEGEWSLPNQIDYLKRVVAWFDSHLRTAAPATAN
jgi:dipeptidyl aminopeptidase/acylaminoacyl peptidase